MLETLRLVTMTMSVTVLNCVCPEQAAQTQLTWSAVMESLVQTISAIPKTVVTQHQPTVVTGMPVTGMNSASLERGVLLELHLIVMMEAPVQRTHVSLRQGVTMPGFTVRQKSTT
jgi:hypothetical protein